MAVQIRHPSLPLQIARIQYTHGQAKDPNREIQFVRATKTSPLEARVFVLGKAEFLGTVPINLISVEMESTSEKLQRAVSERNAFQNPNISAPKAKPDRALSSFTDDLQNEIVSSINLSSHATGGRRIEVESESIGQNKYETIVSVKIIDPR